jgi:hypothetical protein
MSLFEDTNPRDLKELLGQIHAREAALPDFQRDFVWDPHMTQELIVSIANNYPAGSLLRIRNTHNLFACREVQGASSLDGYKPTFLVLDGQQRLTSLYQAFYGLGEHRYYLDLRRLLDRADFEECFFHLRATLKKAREYQTFDMQARALILPLSILKGGAGDFGRWTRQVARTVPTDEERVKLEDALSDVEERWIGTIDDYKFPVVTLSDTTSSEAVCTIFETLNRTGVKLSPFELLTARFWPQNVNLRRLWEKAQEDHPIIADFLIDPYYVLQIVSLAARSTPSFKRSDVLNLEARAIEEWWDRAIDGVDKGLKLLRDDCGVIIPTWLPYNTVLIPLVAVLAKLALPGGPEAGAIRHQLLRWYWCSVFGQTYENSPNSQAAKDMAEVLTWCTGGNEPEAVSGFRFDPRILRDTTPRQRALYRGAVCVSLRHGPRDFYNGAKLTGDLIIERSVDDHHVFPQAYLDRQGVTPRLRDCVLNRTLIDRTTNRCIADRTPADYMAQIRTSLGADKFRELLWSHLLPGDQESPLWRNDFDDFLAWRQDKLWQEIQQVTGVTQATDMMLEESAA